MGSPGVVAVMPRESGTILFVYGAPDPASAHALEAQGLRLCLARQHSEALARAAEVPDQYAESARIEHAPFGFWLVDALRPRTIVELGAHHGFSYFVFCQAVLRLQLRARCFAIDSFEGDEHAFKINGKALRIRKTLVFEDAVGRQAQRLTALEDPTDEQLTTLIADDLAPVGAAL